MFISRIIILSLCCMISISTRAQNLSRLARCSDRPNTLLSPWAGDGDVWCVERVDHNTHLGVIGYTNLAIAADNTLYAILPEHGQLIHFSDTTADLLPSNPTVILDGLKRPTALTIHQQSIYIAALTQIYRYDIVSKTTTILINDFPAGWTGYPSGGIIVHKNRLYIGAGGDHACSPGRGAIYSFDLEGNDRQLIAEGIQSPTDIAYFDNQLWVIDTATDRLLEVVEGADYGVCSGHPLPATIRHYTFKSGSAPIAIEPYLSNTLPLISNSLLVALKGNSGIVTIEGYEVTSLVLEEYAWHENTLILPLKSQYATMSEQKMHVQGSGFYPHHVYGITVDHNGWIYISAGDGQILALRPI